MFWELCQALEIQDKQNRVSAFREFSVTRKTNLECMPADYRMRGAQVSVTRAAITRHCRLGGFNGKNLFLHSSVSWKPLIKVQQSLVLLRIFLACR